MTTSATETAAAETISPATVMRRRAEGEVVELIDVRTRAEYAQLHAEGAKLIPLDELDPQAVLAARDGPVHQPLILICKSGSRASKAAAKFRACGFDNVLCVEGGTEAWERAALPVVRGTSRVISLERQVRIAAGTLVLIGVLLGWLIHPALLALSAFVGGGLIFAGITDWCGMGLLLAKMPWNRRA